MLPRLREYLGGILRQLDGQMLAANGPEDHIHVLANLSPKHALSDVMRVLKTNSSKWIHTELPGMRLFRWEDGYAAFSVSRSVMPKVTAYLRNQQAHHRRVSFREELVALFDAHGIEYDARHLPS